MNISEDILNCFLILILCIGIVYCLWLNKWIISFLIGLLLAYLLNPAVLYIEKGFSRLSAILLPLLILIIIIGGNILVPIIY